MQPLVLLAGSVVVPPVSLDPLLVPPLVELLPLVPPAPLVVPVPLAAPAPLDAPLPAGGVVNVQ